MAYPAVGQHRHGLPENQTFLSSSSLPIEPPSRSFSSQPAIDDSWAGPYNSLSTSSLPAPPSDLDLDPGINYHKDHSRVNNPRVVSRYAPATRPINMSGENYRLQRFRYTYSNCPSHVLVCLKGTYSLLAFKCFFCARDRLGVIFQCNNCGTYICGSCKESNKKFRWTRGKDPEYFGR